MHVAPRPANEDQRILALRQFDILDSEKEQLFDDLTNLAADICGTPISLITLVDSERVWLKSTQGLDATEMPRNQMPCAYAIMNDNGLVVNDLSLDQRFNAEGGAESGMRFYAGTPLRTREGLNLGTLCVLDSKPREISDTQLDKLRLLARQAMSQIELRHNLNELARTTRKAMSLENLIKQYTSRSVWERADHSVEKGHLEIGDEEVDGAYLFLDVVGFTKLSESLGSSGTVELLNTYFRPIVDVVFQNHGDIDKFVGDQLFCIFPDSASAVKTAFEIRTALQKLNEEREGQGRLTLSFTMGINDGPAIRANVGGVSRRDNTLIGNSVNVAARLQKACEPGGILATNSVFERANHFAKSAKRVKFKLKNVSEPVLAHYIE